MNASSRVIGALFASSAITLCLTSTSLALDVGALNGGSEPAARGKISAGIAENGKKSKGKAGGSESTKNKKASDTGRSQPVNEGAAPTDGLGNHAAAPNDVAAVHPSKAVGKATNSADGGDLVSDHNGDTNLAVAMALRA